MVLTAAYWFGIGTLYLLGGLVFMRVLGCSGEPVQPFDDDNAFAGNPSASRNVRATRAGHPAMRPSGPALSPEDCGAHPDHRGARRSYSNAHPNHGGIRRGGCVLRFDDCGVRPAGPDTRPDGQGMRPGPGGAAYFTRTLHD